jgi:hypothetical protein
VSAPRWNTVPVPPRVERLKRDKIGRPVPWFVAWIDGEPDFRIVAPGRLAEALRLGLCWICGQQISSGFGAFVVGPMCVINRTSAEPPAHVNCAEYAVRVCPFLAIPAARRRETSMPDTVPPAGVMIRRNPGVAVIWVTKRFDVWFPTADEFPLITLGDPIDVFWFAEGRRAYRGEVLESLAAGLPELRRVAMDQDQAEGGTRCVEALDAQVRRARPLIPTDSQPMEGAQYGQQQ